MASEFFSHSFDYADYFRRSATFLSQHRWIFDQSNTKFVQAGILDAFPVAWIQDFKRATNEELNQIPLGYINEAWCDDLRQFLRTVHSLTVKYESKGDSCSVKPATAKGISPKKLYEIRNLTRLIGDVCEGNETLLDFGSGLGYLSQSLHSAHYFKVLGLEGDLYRVQSAQRRQAKLFPDSLQHVRYLQHFIQEESFAHIQETLKSAFSDGLITTYAIVGLHACADLSITAIKMFLSQDSCTKLVIMPCCYHKLACNSECTQFKNFPISDPLRDASDNVTTFIGRPFLRLGCQQTSARWKSMTAEEHTAHGSSMFERSLVEAVVEPGQTVAKRKNLSSKDSRRILDKYLPCTEAGSESGWSEQQRKRMEELGDKYSEGSQLAEYLTCLQTCLQPICENLILLDRMCYIEMEAQRRNTGVRCNLVKFANDNLSPRCFVIIAEKSRTDS